MKKEVTNVPTDEMDVEVRRRRRSRRRVYVIIKCGVS